MSAPLAANGFTFVTQGALDPSFFPSYDVIGIRSTTSLIKVYVDGALQATNSSADSGTVPNIKPSYGALSVSDVASGNFSAFREQVAFNGGLITETDLANIRTRVFALNAALGRL